MGKKYKWHKVAASAADIQCKDNEIIEVTVDGKKICLSRSGDDWFGMAHTCPHAGAPMTDGYLNKNCEAVCPVHQLKFNLRTGGRDINGEGYTLKTYPVELRPDGLFIGFEEAGGLFSKWF